MIYLDHAATSWPKPPAVIEAMVHVMENAGANPGRSGHRLARQAAQVIFETREKMARFFNIKDSNRMIFTKNATEALNLGIKGLIKPGEHVITSSMEHNSVTRPLKAMEDIGVEVTKVNCTSDGQLMVEDIAQAIRTNTKLIMMTHASNVTGTLYPIEKIGVLARQHGIRFMVDGSQSAGIIPIDVEQMQIDVLAFPGHKGLLGPQGTGGLFIREGITLLPLLQGGTGGHSELERQPDVIPDVFESGTHNTPGIAGLGAGIGFIMEEGIDKIRRHEEQLTQQLLDGLKDLSGIKIYGSLNAKERVGVVSVNLEGMEAAEIGFLLDQQFDIAVRPGLHCAPDAHRTIGTFPTGTVRFSVGYSNTAADIERAVEAMRNITVEMNRFTKLY